jgi:xylan 1,4-beta-xylosidase
MSPAVLLLAPALLAVADSTTAITTSHSFFEVNASATTPFSRAWQECVGSGHAALALRADYREHLALARERIGFRRMRAHGILNTDILFGDGDFGPQPPGEGDLATAWTSGASFTNVDSIYDFLVVQGMQPLVELSFTPAPLANQTCQLHPTAEMCCDGASGFTPGAGGPPENLEHYEALVGEFVTHCVARYGAAEVATWYFEVFNEPGPPCMP